MKKFFLLVAAALTAATSFADYRAVVFKGATPVSQTKVANIVSLTAKNNVLTQNSDGAVKNFAFAEADSMVFLSDTVYIQYNGATATVKNPLANVGVSVVANGADVVVTTDTSIFDMKDVVFALSGTAANGSFKMNQLKRTTVLLNNLQLVSSTGAAIAMVGDKGVTLKLQGVNMVADADTRALTDTVGAAIYVNDNLEIAGLGSLSVAGSYKQGIFAKDDLTVNEGSLLVVALKSALRVKDNLVLNGGSVDAISTTGSCIDVNDSIFVNGGKLESTIQTDDSKAITCDGGFFQSGGQVLVAVQGDGSKGIKVGSTENGAIISPSDILISGGTLAVTYTSAGVYTDAYGETSSPAGLKADGNVTINGTANVNVSAPSNTEGVRGIASDGNVTIGGQSVVKLDILSGEGKSWCVKTEGTLYLNPACIKAACNEDNPKFDSDKAGLYKASNVSTIAF